MKGRDLLILKAELNIESLEKFKKLLGIRGTHTIYEYLLRDELPQTLALACAALRAGLEPYAPSSQVTNEISLRMEAHSGSTLRWMELQLRLRSRPEQSLAECDEGGAA